MGKNKAGRPSKYDPKYCRELILFFEQEPFYEIELPHYFKPNKGEDQGKVKWIDFKRLPHRIPTVREFCKKVNIHYDTFYRWVKKYEEFSDAFTHAKELRKWFLIENGLNGLYNPIFAKFVAINLTDMVDKKETEHSGNVTVKIDKELQLDGNTQTVYPTPEPTTNPQK